MQSTTRSKLRSLAQLHLLTSPARLKRRCRLLQWRVATRPVALEKF